MTILWPATASSTVCLAVMPVLGAEDVMVEKKEPMVRLYIPWNIWNGMRKSQGYVCGDL